MSAGPIAFRSDLDQAPEALDRLATAISDERELWPIAGVPRRLLLTGMGSSYFAADVCARRLRAAGVDAVGELASAAQTWPAAPDLTVVAISAGGSSAETLRAVAPHLGTSRVIALTNRAESELASQCDASIDMRAGEEVSGVACRSFRNTIGALLALESQVAGRVNASDVLFRAADGARDLLSRSPIWVSDLLPLVDSPDGVWFLAPAERMSSALQGALMVREGPRRRADACETGDWSHVDVYLTKTLDYRAIVFTGSRWDAQAAHWMTERGSTNVAIGGTFPGAAYELRYDGDDDPLVALLTEPLVAELLAVEWWREGVRDHGL